MLLRNLVIEATQMRPLMAQLATILTSVRIHLQTRDFLQLGIGKNMISGNLLHLQWGRGGVPGALLFHLDQV